jgi:hypothetical protein
MGKELVHTSTFTSREKSTGKRSRYSRSEYGYVNPDGKALPVEYLVRITSIRNKCTIVAPIQEPMRIKSESRWDQFVPAAMLGNKLLQAATQGRVSLITRATSRRMWMGSTPMVLNLNLVFEAVKDPFIEVTEPIRLLQSMALPSDPTKGKGANPDVAIESLKNFDIKGFLNAMPLLLPPGPTPFTLDGLMDLDTTNKANQRSGVSEIEEGLKGGDIIIVEWGRLLTFYNVIVKEVSPTIYNMPDQNGDPMRADVSMTFETWEMMTVESLQDVFEKSSLPGDGGKQ